VVALMLKLGRVDAYNYELVAEALLEMPRLVEYV
jgi:hypothetical protein